MEGYVYLGQYFDMLGRELTLSDKKIGLSKDPVSREYQLNRTKSPIGYTIISLFKVDDMNKVEKMLHSILDGRRVFGEWFKDDEDTLTGEFINFMIAYGGEPCDISEIKENKVIIDSTPDLRLVNLGNAYGCDVELVRTYLGVDYDVLLRRDGILVFNGEEFDTPNKLYNNGIVKFVKGVKGGSGTNNLSQFKIKFSGERLVDN
jgi:hypothetical protein